MKSIDKFVLVLVASLALLLAGCGGGSSSTEPAPEPELTAYEMALASINSASTAEDAQAAYDDVKEQVTAAEGEKLEQAVANRTTALQEMADEMAQKDGLKMAADAIDTSDLSTAENIQAAKAAIAGLQAALDEADDVSDADKGMYQSQLDAAQLAVDMTEQQMALDAAHMALDDAITALAGEATQEEIAAADKAVKDLQDAIDAAVDVPDKSMYATAIEDAAGPIMEAKDTAEAMVNKDKEAMDQRMADQLKALTAANNALDDAVAALVGSPTQEQIDAAEQAVEDLQDAIDDATDVSDKSMYATAVTDAAGPIATAKAELKAAEEALAKEQEEADKKMMAMAKKLFDGLKDDEDGGTTATEMANRALKGGSITVENDMVTVMSTAITTGVPVKKSSTAVPALGDWAGADYVDTASGTTNHVVLYNNRGTKSKPFNDVYGDSLSKTSDDSGLEITEQGASSNGLDSHASLIKGDGFATAGTKPHTENPGDKVSLSGTFDGVSGTYSCAQVAAAHCTSMVDGGIVLNGGWTFVPSSLTAPTQTMDKTYLAFGWWSRETPNGVDVVAITVADVDGNGTVDAVPNANSVADTINGTATYKGGAAGKYAVYNPLGNDSSAGAFTANAALTVDFTGDKISGELTDFMSGGESMDWMVELDDGSITAGGIINGMTTWSMGETSGGDDGGMWSGNFYKSNGAESGDEETQAPAAVTGEFTAMYDLSGSNIGQMVGAFGADLED